ncbi:hypothetical protein FRC08_013059 [Ceratobasidium sp. 394]|nr:hypothetical protein FRC08_013059 [Ceratobasidium sp. 394]
MSRNTPTNQDLSGNNKAQPPVILFQHLSDSEKENLSIAAAATIPPWTASRIARNLQFNENGHWTTKRTIIQRLALDIPPKELVAVPGFEADVQAALGKPTVLDKFRALDNVFQIW